MKATESFLKKLEKKEETIASPRTMKPVNPTELPNYMRPTTTLEISARTLEEEQRQKEEERRKKEEEQRILEEKKAKWEQQREEASKILDR